ncbi:MAG: hypothetical protein K0Q48_3050, partial [Bacillota bacterium]|nr:hypothetical protein [Bacillota bacterium]
RRAEMGEEAEAALLAGKAGENGWIRSPGALTCLHNPVFL